jgi:hypothetical protein
MNRKNNMMLNKEVIHSTAVKIVDEIQPTVQQLLSYRANLLSDLASDLLAANAIDVPAGRLIRDELRAIAADIRALAPEEPHENKVARTIAGKVLDEVLLPQSEKEWYTLEELLAESDRWEQSRR